jgi:hypothetical protein
LQAALGEYAAATEQVRAARAVFMDRKQPRFTIDCSLVLAQLAALQGLPEDMRAELQRARELQAATSENHGSALSIEAIAARLNGERPRRMESAGLAEQALLSARTAVLDGDRAAALQALEQARRERIELTPLAEEYRWLRRELGLPLGELPALDPPFPPYHRFVARSAMGESASLAPKPQAPP